MRASPLVPRFLSNSRGLHPGLLRRLGFAYREYARASPPRTPGESPREIGQESRNQGTRKDRALAFGCWGVALIVMLVFAGIAADLLVRGGALDVRFLVEAPSRSGRAGGIGPILVSTAAILAICIAVCAPLGVAAALLLSEWRGRGLAAGRVIGLSLDVLAGVPSIVFGLFGSAFFCRTLDLGFSLLSGGLTLACMALPLVARTAEAGFRAVPLEYRAGAAALGLSRAAVARHVTVPAAMPSILAGLALGIGRALAETAALLFTSGYVDRLPGSLWDSGRAMSVHVYDLAMNVPGGDPNAYRSAFVLIVMILAIQVALQGGLGAWARRRWHVA